MNCCNNNEAGDLMTQPVIILGSGGHAKVLVDILRELTIPILGYTDIPLHVSRLHSSITYLGDDDQINSYDANEVILVNGLGAAGLPLARKRIYDQFAAAGYTYMTVIHPSAIISSTAVIKQGVQIMAGVVIQTGSIIGDNAIINTNSTIDHDSVIHSHTHIAPGATICGDVKIGTSSFIGAGATIIQGIKIGNASVVGAGSVVVGTVSDGCVAYGVPAKEVPHD